MILNYLLNEFTDYAEHQEIWMDEQLKKAVNAMVEDVAITYPEILHDKDQLMIDLMIHFNSSINRQELHIREKNLILDEIRGGHFDMFNVVKKAGKTFNRYYHLKFSDDEVGYLTLYFCRSLEKAQNFQEAKVMVVCNTGRGASRFLATRIMNNFPEIHIIALKSVVDLKDDRELLDRVDMIISTVPLTNVDKPFIVVSPLLRDDELKAIKEAVWIGTQPHGKILNLQLNDSVDALVQKYVDYNDALEFSEKLNKSISASVLTAAPAKDYGENYAKLTVITIDFYLDLYGKGLSVQRTKALSGLLSHVIMSFSRWSEGQFIKAADADQMQKRYPELYEKCLKYIEKVSNEFHIFIDPIEAIAVLRYVVIL
jgi:transcriptional antiterminator